MTNTKAPCGAIEAKTRARLALAMITVALSACGGGGTPPPAPVPAPPPPPAAPTLTVTADATSATAGEQAVPLHATLTGSTAPVTWTLSGPGTLSATSGTEVSYMPPDAESLDEASTATVAASAGDAPTRQVNIALAAVDVPGHHWTAVRPAMPFASNVAYANGVFVETTTLGISHSTDGLLWVDVSLFGAPQYLAWGDAGWVGVGTGNGEAFVSTDASAWTRTQNAVPRSLSGIVFGNHTYLAFGTTPDGSAVSTDGVHWTTVAQQLSVVAFGNGEFLALRQNPASLVHDVHPYASSDGVNWHAATDPGGLSNLAFVGGQFVAKSGTLSEATADGLTWVGTTASPEMSNGDLRVAGGALYLLNENDMSVLLPGADWTRASTDNLISEPGAIAANADRYVGVSWNGWRTTSIDGLHWSTQTEGSYGWLSAVDVVDGKFLALSGLGRAMHSTDGTAWAATMILPDTGGPIFFANAMAHAGTTVVAVGEAGTYAGAGGPSGMWVRSADGGTTWARASTTAPADALDGIVYDGHRFVAISASGAVYASPDGDAWGQVGTVQVPSWIRGIVFGGGTYFVYGRGGIVATSTDATHWTAADPAALAGPASVTGVRSAFWDGQRFVIAGTWDDGTNFAAVSADALHWTRQAAPALPEATGITRCGGEYVAVGNQVLASSIDGLDWHAHATVAEATQLNAVACVNGRFVGVGAGSAIVTSTR